MCGIAILFSEIAWNKTDVNSYRVINSDFFDPQGEIIYTLSPKKGLLSTSPRSTARFWNAGEAWK